MWVLIQTQPKSSRFDIRIARPWSLVQTLEARPYCTPLAQRSASASSVNCCTVMTGPKISFWICSSSCCRPESDGRLVEVALVALPVAAGVEAGVVGQPVDHAGDPLELVGVVERAVEDVLVVGQAGLDALGLLGEGGHEVVVDAGPGEHAGGGGAVLAGVEVAGDRDVLGGLLEVGVVEDDDRRLAAELEVDPLEVLGGGGGHLHAGPHRAGDRDHLRASGARPGRGRCRGRRRRR